MKDSRSRAVQLAAADDLFQSIAYAALKVRAGKLEPGEIVRIGSYELVVAEDGEGDGVTVQIIQSRRHIEDMAEARAKDAGLDLCSLGDRERSEWTMQFIGELSETLRMWQKIELRTGPGENITFEKAVYKRSYG